MARYPVTLTQDDNDTLLVEFPDFPEAHTFGEDEEEALARAVDALETIIDAYIRDKRDIPAPSAVTGASVTLPSLVDTKVQIYAAMRAQRVGKAELAKRLNVFLPQVDRLLDVRHGSKIDQLEAAAQALGSSLNVTLVPHEQYYAAALKRYKAVALKSSRKPAERHRSRVVPVHAGVLAAQKARRSGTGGGSKKK
jgi:antitoxin HicB